MKKAAFLFGIGLVLLPEEAAFCNQNSKSKVITGSFAKNEYFIERESQNGKVEKVEKVISEMAPDSFQDLTPESLEKLLIDLAALKNERVFVEKVQAKASEEASNRLKRLRESEERLKQTEEELEKTKERLDQAENELKQFNEQIDGIKAENEQLKRDNESLQKQVNALKAEAAKLKKEVEQLKAEIEKLKEEIKELQSKISKLEKEIEELKQQLADKDKEIEKLKTQLADKDKENNELKADKAKNEEKIKELEKNDDELKKLKRRIKTWINQINAINAAYQQNVATLQEDFEALNKTLKSLDPNDNAGWRGSSKSAKHSISTFEEIVNSFNKLGEELTQRISNKDEAEQSENTGSQKMN